MKALGLIKNKNIILDKTDELSPFHEKSAELLDLIINNDIFFEMKEECLIMLKLCPKGLNIGKT